MKIQLYKKANDKAGAEVDPKDPTKQKWNADSVFVKVENEMVSLAELAKHAKENDYTAIPETIENEMEVNGSMINISDLIANYKDSKKNDDPGKDGKEEVEKGEEKGEEKVVVKKGKKNEEEDDDDEKEEKMKKDKKNKEEKDDDDEKDNEKDEEEETEEKIKKQKKNEKDEKKDVRHFVRLNTARENGTTEGVLTIDTMHNRVDRGIERYGSKK
jgi:hypothetical protein